jgi:hypothetical protein
VIFLRIFLYGYTTLILAIITNIVMKSNKLFTWYDLISIQDLNTVSPLNLGVLLVVYPFILGLSVFIIDRIWKK